MDANDRYSQQTGQDYVKGLIQENHERDRQAVEAFALIQGLELAWNAFAARRRARKQARGASS